MYWNKKRSVVVKLMSATFSALPNLSTNLEVAEHMPSTLKLRQKVIFFSFAFGQLNKIYYAFGQVNTP